MIEQAGILTEEPDVEEKKRNPRRGQLPRHQPGSTAEQPVQDAATAKLTI